MKSSQPADDVKHREEGRLHGLRELRDSFTSCDSMADCIRSQHLSCLEPVHPLGKPKNVVVVVIVISVNFEHGPPASVDHRSREGSDVRPAVQVHNGYRCQATSD